MKQIIFITAAISAFPTDQGSSTVPGNFGKIAHCGTPNGMTGLCISTGSGCSGSDYALYCTPLGMTDLEEEYCQKHAMTEGSPSYCSSPATVVNNEGVFGFCTTQQGQNQGCVVSDVDRYASINCCNNVNSLTINSGACAWQYGSFGSDLNCPAGSMVVAICEGSGECGGADFGIDCCDYTITG